MGTLQHAAVESDTDDPRIPDYKIWAVAQCKRVAEEIVAKYPGGTILREEYLPIDDQILPDGTRHTTAGYCDLASISADETRAEIVDYKFGKNAVTHAQDNLQGIAYMLGLKKKFPKLKTCRVLFFQPHIDHESEHTFEVGAPDALLLRVRTVVARAIEAGKNPEDFSMARATVGTCLFCSLVGRCPKVAELAIQVGRKYAPLLVPDDINTVTLEDPVQVSAGMKLAQVVKLWAESFRKNATTKALNDEGFIPDGYVLVPGQKIKLTHPRRVGEIAKRFVPPEHAEKIDALYDIKITPLDDLIELMAPRGKKTAATEAFRAALVAEGAAEMGQPYSVLRMATDKDTGKTATK